GGKQVGQTRAHGQPERKHDPPFAAVDATANAAHGLVQAPQEWRGATPTLGHGRREKSRAGNADLDAAGLEQAAQRLAIGAHARLAGAVAGAIGQASQRRHRGNEDNPSPAPRDKSREQGFDGVRGAQKIGADLPRYGSKPFKGRARRWSRRGS